MGNELAKRVVKGAVIGDNISKFHVGDFVVFVADFLTNRRSPPRELMFPVGTKGLVVAIDPHEGGGVRIDIEGSGDKRWVDFDELDIIERFEPDAFDRAWLSHDYETARRLWNEATASAADATEGAE